LRKTHIAKGTKRRQEGSRGQARRFPFGNYRHITRSIFDFPRENSAQWNFLITSSTKKAPDWHPKQFCITLLF
jgi:hypothetical protein